RKIRFHDLRHTFASLLLQQGESPQYVKEQMGHHSIQITVDIYGHLIPGANRRAVDRLDDRNLQPTKMRKSAAEKALLQPAATRCNPLQPAATPAQPILSPRIVNS